MPGLVSNLTSNTINIFKRSLSGKGAVRAGKEFTLFISNKGKNDTIEITKSLEDSGLLTGGVTQIVKHEIQKQQGGFLWVLLATLAPSLVQPVVTSVVKGTSERGVRGAERGCIDKNF